MHTGLPQVHDISLSCLISVSVLWDNTLFQMYAVQKARIRSRIRHIHRLKMASFLRAVNYSDTQKRMKEEDKGEGGRKHSVYFA